MRDIRVQFDGESGTRILLNESVEGKMLMQQKYLINTGTSKGTDKIFPQRGTDLMAGAIGGSIIDSVAAEHLGNFAALDTLYFCSYEEHPDIYNGNTYVREFSLTPSDYNNFTRTLSFTAKFKFKDDTETASDILLTSE